MRSQRLSPLRSLLPMTPDGTTRSRRHPSPGRSPAGQMSCLFTMSNTRAPCSIEQAARISKINRTFKDHPAGGARRDRTDDLMLAKHALSQLSYGPKPGRIAVRGGIAKPLWEASRSVVGLGRLERPTSPLSGVRSNHLSYRPGSLDESISREKGAPLKGAAPRPRSG